MAIKRTVETDVYCDSVKWRKNVDKKEAIKELKFEKNISAGVMEQLGTTKALREIVAYNRKRELRHMIQLLKRWKSRFL